MSLDEVWGLIDEVRIGVEIAGSPVAALGDLGPTAVVAGFGNNLGLILGPVLSGSRHELEALDIQTFVNDQPVGRGMAGDLEGGVAESVRFLVGACERSGQSLRAGAWISTGAIGGGHSVTAGDRFSTHVGGVVLISGKVAA
jgi:2-keto-4-pentenoate hydratase